MKIRTLPSVIAVVLVASVARAEEAPALPSVDPDPIFHALEEEVARAATLRVEGLDSPYWAAAFAQDMDVFEVVASFGALLGRDGGRRGMLDAQIRLGAPSLDNTNFSDDFWGGGGMRRGSFPAEPDSDALRHALWLQFDDRYKKAAEAMAKKRAFLQTNEVKDRPADFGPAPVVSLVLPREKLSVDRDRWTKLVKQASAIFRSKPSANACRVGLRASVSHQYFVSSEGVRHRFAEPLAQIAIQASTQSSDGMELSTSWERWGRTEKDLPSDAEVMRAAQSVAAQIEALAKAPKAQEDYAGPVLFSGRAAALFYLATLGEPLSRPRDELGAARQGRLVDRLGKHIASKVVTARDDPNATTFRGQVLLGHFPLDDDSVKPQAITLVERGVLKTHYMSRVPTKRIKQTNGHSRNGEGAPGSLFVETSSPQTVASLTKRLLELAKEEDYDYGIVVEDFDTANGMSAGRVNEVMLPPPSVVWKVWSDGRRELVRGYTFKPMSFRILKDVQAMGDDPTVANVELRHQRTSAVAPSTLVRMVELQKTNAEFEKPPATPKPLAVK